MSAARSAVQSLLRAQQDDSLAAVMPSRAVPLGQRTHACTCCRTSACHRVTVTFTQASSTGTKQVWLTSLAWGRLWVTEPEIRSGSQMKEVVEEAKAEAEEISALPFRGDASQAMGRQLPDPATGQIPEGALDSSMDDAVSENLVKCAP